MFLSLAELTGNPRNRSIPHFLPAEILLTKTAWSAKLPGITPHNLKATWGVEREINVNLKKILRKQG